MNITIHTFEFECAETPLGMVSSEEEWAKTGLRD
jgi:hypothetical protein